MAVAAAVYNGPLAGGQPAHLYPAGVSPQACPNFPNCNNPAVAANPQQPTNNWAPQNQWNAPAQSNWNNGGQWNNNNGWNQGNQWNSAPVPQYGGNDVTARLNRGEYVGDGDYHGEGLAEALAPGYEGMHYKQVYYLNSFTSLSVNFCLL